VGELRGDTLSRSPKGFDPGHPAAELIRMKDWIFEVKLDAEMATTPELFAAVLERFRAMAPLVEYLNRPLLARKPRRELLTEGW
jgi:uncharacterized protein (DUF2461 family)